MKQRIEWLDNLRAIAIFFVVLGHTVGLPEDVEKLIFSFHMPVFFWISGLLAKETIRGESFTGFVKKRWRKRLIPYVSFSVISYVAWFFLFRHFGSQAELNISPLRPVIGFFYGNGINHWLVTNTVLWFFLCLFVTEIFFYFVIKVPSTAWMVLVLLAFSVVGYLDVYFNPPNGFRLPWNIDIALTTTVFYGAGFLSKGYVLEKKKSSPWRPTIFGGSLFLYVIFSLLNRKVALVAGVYGNYLYFYLAAMAGIFFWMELSRLMPSIRLVSLIGKSTLTIFSLHLLVFPFITAALVYGLKMPSTLKSESVLLSLAYTVLSILVLLPVSGLINRYLPFILGESRKTKTREKRR